MGLFDGCTNMYGPLDAVVKRRVLRFINDPSDETWTDISGTIVNASFGLGMTIWQAVIALDPTFPREGPSTTFDRQGREVAKASWSRIPDPLLVARAIKFAANCKPAKKRAR